MIAVNRVFAGVIENAHLPEGGVGPAVAPSAVDGDGRDGGTHSRVGDGDGGDEDMAGSGTITLNIVGADGDACGATPQPPRAASALPVGASGVSEELRRVRARAPAPVVVVRTP